MAGRQKLTGWRKIANALWRAPADPQIYGALELDATAVLRVIERSRAAGHHVTATHLVGRAVAQALVAVPDLNVRLVGGYAVSRGGIDVFFITSVGRGKDLTGVKIENADRKTVVEVAKELGDRAARMKSGVDPDFAKAKRAMDALPLPLLRLVMRIGAWLAGDHAMSIRALGVAASPFGSAMVSSVGSLGLPMGFSPLAWMYKVPLLVLVGEITEKPVAVSGRVEVRSVLPITVTIDHRYVDGAQLSEALKAFRAYVADPAAFEVGFGVSAPSAVVSAVGE